MSVESGQRATGLPPLCTPAVRPAPASRSCPLNGGCEAWRGPVSFRVSLPSLPLCTFLCWSLRAHCETPKIYNITKGLKQKACLLSSCCFLFFPPSRVVGNTEEAWQGQDAQKQRGHRESGRRKGLSSSPGTLSPGTAQARPPHSTSRRGAPEPPPRSLSIACDPQSPSHTPQPTSPQPGHLSRAFPGTWTSGQTNRADLTETRSQ